MTNQFTELEMIADEELQAASGGFAVGALVKGGLRAAGKWFGRGAAAYGGYKTAEAIDGAIDQAIG